MRKVFLTALCALVLGAGNVFAQGFLCELHGAADLAPGLDASVQGGSLKFAFKGDLTNCQGDNGGATKVCARGTLDNASCAGNVTNGTSFVVCKGDCNTAPGAGQASCKVGAPLLSGTFQGACAGSVCAGGATAPGTLYEVMFDQATVDAALAACNPAAPAGSVTKAGFDGYIGYQY